MKTLVRHPDYGYLDSLLWVPKEHVNVEGTKRALTFTFTSSNKITTLSLYKETANHLLLPREFWDLATLPFPVIDTRPLTYPQVSLPSNIKLDVINPKVTIQTDALNALLQTRGGILQLACGIGKTIIALELASRMQVPTLIIVDNTQLLNQWRIAILGNGQDKKPNLRISPNSVGLIQGPIFDWKKPIVLATYQTLANLAHAFPEEVRRWFGLIIWDEAHHMAAPTFSRTADLFYGYRLGLTATPTRTDGQHVIYDLHLGKVIYKYLQQELKPRIYFRWTGLELDFKDENVRQSTTDKNGELHLTKLSSYFGSWRPRLQLILQEVKKAVDVDRKIIVLSNSIDEVVNLLALWNNYPSLWTDIPIPTALEVGATVPPISLEPKELRKILKVVQILKGQLSDKSLNPVKRENLVLRKKDLEQHLAMHTAAKKVETEYKKRQRLFLRNLLDYSKSSNAGIMIHRVKVSERTEMLQTKQVIFAIPKYGKEGLDKDTLDTIIVSTLFTDKNILQQVMGRIQRLKKGKKGPVLTILEDNVGPLIGMCRKLRRILLLWPQDEGGPYSYTMVGHPKKEHSKPWTTTLRGSGPSLTPTTLATSDDSSSR